MADITLPDGTRIPEYALESTQEEILKLLSAQVKADQKSLDKYKELVEIAKKTNDSNEDQEQLQEEQIKLLHGIREDSKKGKNNLGNGLNYLADGAIKAGTVLAGAALTAFGFAAKSAYNLGNTMAELGNVGIGLGGMESATIASIAGLQRLGLSATQAATLMRDSSSIMAVAGQTAFVNMNAELAKITGSGARFGMTMNELTEIAREDLEIRQKLGILDNLNASQAAKRSQQLYGQQLAATKLLGKSIDDIRGASTNTLQDAEMSMRVLAISTQHGEKAAAQFVDSMRAGLGNLAAAGLDQNIIDAIGTQIGTTVAFASEEGQALFQTLSVLDDKMGSGLTQSIQRMNELAKTDPGAVAGEMEKFQKKLMSTAANMDENQFKEYAAFLQSGALGPMGAQMAQSIAELRQAHKRYEGIFGEGASNMIEQFGNLAQGAKTFDNALGQVQGAFGGMFTDITGALGPAVGGLAGAFQDTAAVLDKDGKVITEGQMGISTAFKEAMTEVSKAIAEMFGDANGEFKGLGETLRDYVVPKIKQFTEWFKSDGKDALESFKNGLISFKDFIVGVTAPVRSIFNLLTGDLEGAKESLVGSFDSLAGKIGMAVGGFIIFNKLLRGAGAAQGAIGKIAGMFGKGGGAAANTAGSAAGGAAAGAGKGIGSGLKAFGVGAGQGVKALGQGLGKAIGAIGAGIGDALAGIIGGVGKGLAAFPAAAVKGAAYLAASIGIIAGGVKAAAFILNLGGEDALKQLSSGFASFNDIDGMNLIKVGGGLTALGIGLAAFGAGSVMGALGNLVGGLMDSMNEFFGGTSVFDKVQEFGNYNFPVDRIKSNADAIVAYGLAMGALGAGTGLASVSNLIGSVIDSVVSLFGGDTPLEKVQKFGEMALNKDGIKANSDAIFEYAIAMGRLADIDVPGATISQFMSDIGQGLLQFLGASSPAEKLAEFGAMNINASGVRVNAQAVFEYAQAMSALKGVDVKDLSRATAGLMDDRSLKAFEKLKEFSELDIGAFSMRENNIAIRQYALGMKEMQDVDANLAADNIITLSKAYASFNLLNPERLAAIAEAMASINENAVKGVSLGDMDMGLAISTGLADLKAPKTAPTPSDVQVPLLPGETAESSSKASDTAVPSNETLESLARKTNVKLDELIGAVKRLA